MNAIPPLRAPVFRTAHRPRTRIRIMNRPMFFNSKDQPALTGEKPGMATSPFKTGFAKRKREFWKNEIFLAIFHQAGETKLCVKFFEKVQKKPAPDVPVFSKKFFLVAEGNGQRLFVNPV
jgi:hypothetical protein